MRAGCAGYEDRNRVSWVQEALSWAAHDGKALGSCHTDWSHVRDSTIWYFVRKTFEHRFDGEAHFDLRKVSTWDALEGKELVAWKR